MRARLFEVEHAQVCERLADFDGVVNRISAVHIDEYVDIIAHGGAHGFHGGNRVVRGVVHLAGDGAMQFVAGVALLNE